MAQRTVYGNTYSSNGWPMVDTASCTWVTVPGTNVSLQIQNGWPLALLRAFAADFNAYVEPLRDADSACWTATNSVSTSNHLSGTAMDLNWNSHPFQKADAGFDAAKIARVRELLDFYEGLIFWGNDWGSPKDAMHFQLSSLANGGPVNTYGNPAVADFIARKIRPDGFSTFQRGGGGSVLAPAVGLTADVLWRIAEQPDRMPITRYAELLAPLLDCLHDCDCDTVDRRAMWFGQVFHESGGLFYREEIASGAAYDGRTDLGNTQPGDGPRFKGRSFIQVTGRDNYGALSAWAFANGHVPSPTWFIDNPASLAQDQYAFLGVTWYWTTQRPMNDAADAHDLERATRYVNGGLNGLDDRRAIYQRALAENDNLLDPAPSDPWEIMLMSAPFASASHFRLDDVANLSPVEALRQNNAMNHENMVINAALDGEVWAIQLLAALAAGALPGARDFDGAFWKVRAAGLLNAIQAAHPDWIAAATPTAGKAA